ncbi:MAG: type IV pilus secretin PilQ, partial [Myxococcota bacterium]|nr:type IV pilus secretin PilQ [Myxococcota bacterium]
QEPVISRHGTLLFIDFERLGVAAAAPPAFPKTESTGLTLASTDEPAWDQAEATEPKAPVTSLDESEKQLVAQAASVDELPEFSENLSLDGLAGLDQVFAEDDTATAVMDDEFASLSGGPLDDFDEMDDVDFDMEGPASLEPPAAVEVLQEGGITDGKQYVGRRISLDFNDVPVSDVLRLIAEVSDLNLIAGDEVKGAVTIRLVDTPWDQALDVVLLTKGLGFVRVGNILRVAPADVLAAEDELRLQERRNREKLEDLMVKLLPVNYAAVKDMSSLVKRLLSSRGTVNVDERTNTLILKDIASVLDEAVALVKAVDTETPQVMIEAKIVEANLNFSRELGSSWNLAAQPLVDPFGGAVARDDLGGSNFRFHGSNGVAFSNPITSTPTALADLGAYLLDEKLDLNVALRAAESMGEGKVISSPRIVTLDNGEATIEQGVSIPFQTFEGGDAKLEFIDAVLSLKVVPHITSDRSIIMDIEVTRNAPDESVPTPTGSPAIAKAEASTTTLVKDGQTLVLGGIYTIDKSERESRVPYLHRLPVIGSAFRSKELTDLRKELLIFVTPRIVKSPSLATRN